MASVVMTMSVRSPLKTSL